jgi:hypothetical protein
MVIDFKSKELALDLPNEMLCNGDIDWISFSSSGLYPLRNPISSSRIKGELGPNA